MRKGCRKKHLVRALLLFCSPMILVGAAAFAFYLYVSESNPDVV